MSDYGTPPPNQPPPDQPPPPGGYGGPVPSGQPRKGFFGALFDFGFEHFITPIIGEDRLRARADRPGDRLAGLPRDRLRRGRVVRHVVLILGPIAVILYLAFIRITLEFHLASSG